MYTTKTIATRNILSDEFVLRNPVVQKEFQPKCASSIAVRVATVTMKNTKLLQLFLQQGRANLGTLPLPSITPNGYVAGNHGTPGPKHEMPNKHQEAYHTSSTA